MVALELIKTPLSPVRLTEKLSALMLALFLFQKLTLSPERLTEKLSALMLVLS